MTFLVLAPFVAALVAGALTWQHATRLDRSNVADTGEPGAGEPEAGQWAFVLGGLIATVLAITVLQAVLLAGLRSVGQ